MNYYPNGYNNYQMNNSYQVPGPFYMKAQEKKRLSFIGVACGSAVVLFSALGAVLGLLLSRFPNFVNEYYNNSAFANAFNMLTTFLLIGGSFLFAYILLKRKGYSGGIPLGAPYDKSEFFMLLPIGLGICILGSFATGMFSVFVDAVFGIEFTQPDDGSSYNSATGIVLSVIQTALMPAFIEEFAIRGVVMQSLRRYGDGFAIVASAAVFALMHGNMIQIPFAFIAGMAIGYIVIKTGTMWTGIAIHFLNNSMAVLSLALIDNFQEATASIILTAIYLVIFITAVICAVLLYRKNRRLSACLSKGTVTYFKNSEKAAAFVLNIPMIIAIILLGFETAQYIN